MGAGTPADRIDCPDLDERVIVPARVSPVTRCLIELPAGKQVRLLPCRHLGEMQARMIVPDLRYLALRQLSRPVIAVVDQPVPRVLDVRPILVISA